MAVSLPSLHSIFPDYVDLAPSPRACGNYTPHRTEQRPSPPLFPRPSTLATQHRPLQLGPRPSSPISSRCPPTASCSREVHLYPPYSTPYSEHTEDSKRSGMKRACPPHPYARLRTPPHVQPAASSNSQGSSTCAESDSTGTVSDDEDLPVDDASHTRRHVCHICSKRFNRPSSLRIHVNTHTGATPYQCPWPDCGRYFNVNSNMRRHYRNHTSSSSPTTSVAQLPSHSQRDS